VDADGKEAVGTFVNGEALWSSLKTRCHFSIMGGAIVDTIFV
jgi:hypothetical protein